MDTITFKGLTTDEVLARVRVGQTNDAHEETSRSLKDILRANILTRFNAYAHSITAQVKRFKIARSELIYGTNKLLTYISLIILMVAPLLIWGQIVRSG